MVACGPAAITNGLVGASHEEYASSPALPLPEVLTLSSSPPLPDVDVEGQQGQLLREMFEQMSLVRCNSDSNLTVEENQEHFECESLLSCELEPPPAKTGRVQCPCPEWIDRIIDDPDFVHEDFALRGEYSGITSFRYFVSTTFSSIIL